jgi:hypothetical protein
MTLGHLQAEQYALAIYMSYLSEEAYCAPRRRGLEYALWEVVLGERREYGRASFRDQHAAGMRCLSEACGGWIVFDGVHGETWVSLSEWQARFQDRKSNSVDEEPGACASPLQVSNAPYSRAELLALDDKRCPDRGDPCPCCGELVPRFGDLNPELFAHLVSLMREDQTLDPMEELRKYTGAPLIFAKIWVIHRGEPQPRYPKLPCRYCGRPLPSERSKQCLHCHADWH